MLSALLKRGCLLAGCAFLLALSACIPGFVFTPTLTPTPTVTLTPSVTPTVTPVAMALVVNAEGITQAEFDAELARYQQAGVELGLTSTPEEDKQAVTDDFIDQLLLSQAAAAAGHGVDDTSLQARIDSLVEQIGGADALSAWQQVYGYTDEEFRTALRRQMAAAWMRDQVIATVPTTADQVHVRQILFYNEADAQSAYARLQAGMDFNTLAAQYDPLTKGELGWFPKGYLVHPSIEEAAFALLPGQYSAVIQSSVGYHILYLVERDSAHPLSPDALQTLQEHALLDWLTEQRNASTIVIAP
jgi:peptidyl-prolyl cis-trans isomerase C